MKTYILYHAQCPDGFGAAYAAWKVLGDKAEYLPVQHQQPAPELKHKSQVYMVDFCYPQATILDYVQKMKQVTILDHHQSAEADLAAIDLAVYPNLSVTFDMQKSGAVLAWEHFHDTPVPEMLQYIQDKDLWKFDLPFSKEFSAGLRGYDLDFKLWDSMSPLKLIEEGKILLRYQNQLVQKICKNMRFTKVAGYEVPTVNSSTLQSEIGNQLCQMYPNHPFAVVYFDATDKRFHSLRSIGDFDVSEIAAQFGGGGHRNASGFGTSLPS
jgi:oligoribonuclease NrnB/cAMP/cGMP phosphodiesterase (DHH superfamily)